MIKNPKTIHTEKTKTSPPPQVRYHLAMVYIAMI